MSFSQLETLTFRPSTTKFKWDITKKSRQLRVSGATDTIHAGNARGVYEILGNIPFTLGSSQSSWVYEIINSGRIKVGLAQSIGEPLISLELGVKELDILEFNLTDNSFSISKISQGSVQEFKRYNITTLGEQEVFYWICSVANNRIGARVYENIISKLSLRADGFLYAGNQKLITQSALDDQNNIIEKMQSDIENLQIELTQVQAQLP